jgi:drug/metabolite transporter (DMT)-like permease
MELNPSKNDTSPRWLILSAFAAVYIIWGSTYLGIKYAIETLPPFLMSGIRFLMAGSLLYGWALYQKTPAPEPIHWKNSFIIGAFLLLCGNGIVVWAEHFIDSSTAALLITLEPIWIVFLLWLYAKQKPSIVILIGVLLGIIGMVLLTGSVSLSGFKQVDLRGVIGISLSTLAWAIGSLYSIRAKIPSSSIQATAMQMLAGGLMLLIVGTVAGEWNETHFENFSWRSVLAFLYLTLVGSLIGYTAYSFLLKHAHPNHVSTYAYVNPVIAVYLGWALADEKITFQTIIASVLLVGAVVIITTYSKKKDS